VRRFIYDDDDDDDDDDDESGDDDLCACLRVMHFRGSLQLICGLCDCIHVLLVEFNSLCSYRV
jgi:hypothetical protein